MIAKQIKGKDFYGLLAYHEKKVEMDQGYVLDTNITKDSTVNMTKEFNMVRQLRPRLGKAVYHVSLNLPHEDKLSDKEFTSLGYDYLKGMGFDNSQYIMYRHTDAKHQHIHIIANRVNYSGEVVSDSKDYERSEHLVRKLETKYGLSTLKNGKTNNKSIITQKEIEKSIRTGKPPIKLVLQQKIDGAMLNSNHIQDFIKELKNKGIYTKFNASMTTGRVTGISFRYEGIIYKGSTLGRQYSWNNIIKHLDYDQERDRSIILENSRPNRGIKKSAVASGFGSEGAIGASGGVAQRVGDAHEKPEYDVAKDQAIGWVTPLVEDNPWNSFKLELDDQNRFKRKKKRKRRRL